MYWKAIYENGTVVEQPTSVPITFQNIDTSGLKKLYLSDQLVCIGVDIKEGILLVNGRGIIFDGFSKKSGYRLVYFLKMKEDKVIYYLGLQTTIDKKNLKRIIELKDKEVRILV